MCWTAETARLAQPIIIRFDMWKTNRGAQEDAMDIKSESAPAKEQRSYWGLRQLSGEGPAHARAALPPHPPTGRARCCDQSRLNPSAWSPMSLLLRRWCLYAALLRPSAGMSSACTSRNPQ